MFFLKPVNGKHFQKKERMMLILTSQASRVSNANDTVVISRKQTNFKQKYFFSIFNKVCHEEIYSVYFAYYKVRDPYICFKVHHDEVPTCVSNKLFMYRLFILYVLLYYILRAYR